MAKAKKPAARNSKPKATNERSSNAASAAPTGESVSSASKAAAVKKSSVSSSAADATATDKSTPATLPKTVPVKTEPAAKVTPTAAKSDPKVETAKPVKVEAKSDPKTETADKGMPQRSTLPAPVQEPQESRSVFLPLVLGGLIAGGVGFAAAEYNWFNTRSPSDDGLKITVSEQAERLTALENAEAVTPDVDLSAVDDLTSQIASLSETLTDIEARLKTVEQRPAGNNVAVVEDRSAFEQEFKELRASAEEQRAEIAALLSNAQSVEAANTNAARSAQLQAALTQINTAISSGQPFADTLSMLSDNGVDDIPAALTDVATDGVATLNNLQTRFPDSAREALGVARTSGAMEGESGVGGFLKRQLGARSTAPREGADPDAVLSRAEAVMRDGGLDAALTELDALPQDVQSAMQDWLEDARARNAAQIATQDLSQSLSAN